MAHSEACQLFIEEQIREGLEQGRTPYSIGKELTKMIEKYFKATIPPETLKSRAYQMKKKSVDFNRNRETIHNNSENTIKQQNQQVTRKQEPGPGRLPKYAIEPKQEPYSDALRFARLAIHHLSQISEDDPKREEAFVKVFRWLKDHQKGGRTNG